MPQPVSAGPLDPLKQPKAPVLAPVISDPGAIPTPAPQLPVATSPPPTTPAVYERITGRAVSKDDAATAATADRNRGIAMGAAGALIALWLMGRIK